jgi:hypothetical protein
VKEIGQVWVLAIAAVDVHDLHALYGQPMPSNNILLDRKIVEMFRFDCGRPLYLNDRPGTVSSPAKNVTAYIDTVMDKRPLKETGTAICQCGLGLDEGLGATGSNQEAILEGTPGKDTHLRALLQ